MKLNKCLMMIAALVFEAGFIKADLITWGGSFGDNYYLADGVTKLDSSFWFELGTFDSFTPTASNVSNWAANWHVFDRAVAAGSSPTPPSSLVQFDPNYLGASVVAGNVNISNVSGFGVSGNTADIASHVTNSHPNYIAVDNSPTANFDFSNKTAYVWVFNDRRTNVGAQWGLYTGVFTSSPNPNIGSSWAFSPLDAPGCLCTDLGAAFYFSDITTNVVGTSTQPSPTTTLTLAVVPEPGSAILILATGLALLIKRRRLPTMR
ncbi:MAG: PEP-CTERM sorting domain-containing protein [Verrucomicrobiaceae bacterium]